MIVYCAALASTLAAELRAGDLAVAATTAACLTRSLDLAMDAIVDADPASADDLADLADRANAQALALREPGAPPLPHWLAGCARAWDRWVAYRAALARD